MPTDAVRCFLTDPGGDVDEFDKSWFMVSLDHTVWFHQQVVPDRWHLHAFSCDRVVGDRALTSGRVYFRARLQCVATIRRRAPAR